MTRSIYQEAIERWGAESQLRMVQEECGELVAAINRFGRKRCGPEAVAEEIADVMITCEQAAIIVGEDLVAARKAEKLERLKARLAAPAREAKCPRCYGHGETVWDDTRIIKCGACAGTGKVREGGR